MDWIKDNWEKIALFAVTLIVLLGSAGLIRESMAYPSKFEQEVVVPKDEFVAPDFGAVAEAQGLIDEKNAWSLPVRGAIRRKLPLFVSIPIVEVEGTQIDMTDPSAPLIREPVSNQWLMDNNLDFLSSSILEQDSDNDKFSNLEEWEAKTSPVDPSDHPIYGEKMVFMERKQQSYTLNFKARPDPQTFQIARVPTTKWPRRQTFLIGVGDVSEDGQFRLESFEEKQGKSSVGITVDATELTITHLPTGTTHKIVKGVDYTIPTYFAQMRFPLGDNKPFFKKVGESFALDIDPETKYKVVDIKEDRAVISPGEGKPNFEVARGTE